MFRLSSFEILIENGDAMLIRPLGFSNYNEGKKCSSSRLRRYCKETTELKVKRYQRLMDIFLIAEEGGGGSRERRGGLSGEEEKRGRRKGRRWERREEGRRREITEILHKGELSNVYKYHVLSTRILCSLQNILSLYSNLENVHHVIKL